MNYLKLPRRVFNSPLIKFVNFKDGSFVNLIRLTKPYANGAAFAVYETTKSAFCSNGLFKTLEKALEKFELMKRNGAYESPIRNGADIIHSNTQPTKTIYFIGSEND